MVVCVLSIGQQQKKKRREKTHFDSQRLLPSLKMVQHAKNLDHLIAYYSNDNLCEIEKWSRHAQHSIFSYCPISVFRIFIRNTKLHLVLLAEGTKILFPITNGRSLASIRVNTGIFCYTFDRSKTTFSHVERTESDIIDHNQPLTKNHNRNREKCVSIIDQIALHDVSSMRSFLCRYSNEITAFCRFSIIFQQFTWTTKNSRILSAQPFRYTSLKFVASDEREKKPLISVDEKLWQRQTFARGENR